jgi:hypothetical protein
VRRRRSHRRGDLTAEEVIELSRQAHAANSSASLEVHNYAVREALSQFGYTPLDVFRARYWIRRGRPAEYRWDG